MRSRSNPSLVLCAPLLLCALKLHGGLIHSPAGVMQEVTRSCSILRIAATRRAGRTLGSSRDLPYRGISSRQI